MRHKVGEIERSKAIMQKINRIRVFLNGQDENFRTESVIEKIIPFVKKDEPLHLILPAFPCKSPNRLKKVLGEMPDKAEELGLVALNDLCKEIWSVHQPGAFITVASDGRVFADLIDVPDSTVKEFGFSLRKMSEKIGNNIRWFGLDEIFKDWTDSEMRLLLLQQFGRQIGRIEEKIATCEDTRRLYCCLMKFLFEDTDDGRTMSNTQRQIMCKERSKLMIQRNEAYSNLLGSRFPDAIRLSIHPHLVSSGKLPVGYACRLAEIDDPLARCCCKRRRKMAADEKNTCRRTWAFFSHGGLWTEPF